MKQIFRISLFAILLCFSINLCAQDCDESVGVTFKVNYNGTKPNVLDFFTAYAKWRLTTNVYDDSKTVTDDAQSYIILGKARHTKMVNGQTKVMDKKVVNISGGYISYHNGVDPDQDIPLGLECCYWNTADKKKVIFVVNCIDDNPQYTNTFHLDFFEYDNSTAVMMKILPPCNVEYPSQEWTNSYSNTEMRSVVFRLPQVGKNISLEISGITERGEALTLREEWEWNGYGFTAPVQMNASASVPDETVLTEAFSAYVMHFDDMDTAEYFANNTYLKNVVKSNAISGETAFLILPCNRNTRIDVCSAEVDNYGNVSEGDEMYIMGEVGHPLLFNHTVPEGIPSLVVVAVDEVGRRNYWTPVFSGEYGALISTDAFISLLTNMNYDEKSGTAMQFKEKLMQMPAKYFPEGHQSTNSRRELLNSSSSLQVSLQEGDGEGDRIWDLSLYPTPDGDAFVMVTFSSGLDYMCVDEEYSLFYSNSNNTFEDSEVTIFPVAFEEVVDTSKLTENQKRGLKKYFDEGNLTYHWTPFGVTIDLTFNDNLLTIVDDDFDLVSTFPKATRIWNGWTFVKVE